MIMAIVLILTVLCTLAVTYGLGGFGSWFFAWELPLFGILFYAAFVGLALGVIWCICRSRVRLDEPSREDPVIRRLIYHVADFIFHVLRTRVEVSGLEKLPREGRMVLVCNHISLLDPVALVKVFRKSQLAFISKRENQTFPIVNYLMQGVNCQLLNRENDREALTVILKCIDLIKADACSIAVFPEGYTSLNGHLQPFRNGVFKIAQRAKVPVVVCTLEGTRDIFRNFLHLRRTRVILKLVDTVSPEDFKGTKELGDYIHAMMEANLGFWGTPMLEGTRKEAADHE